MSNDAPLNEYETAAMTEADASGLAERVYEHTPIPDSAFNKELKQALCAHEPNNDRKYYTPKGWRAPCAKCGIPLDIQPHLELDVNRKRRVHMSKKERIARRKMPLFVVDKKEEKVSAPKVRIPKYIKKGRKQ